MRSARWASLPFAQLPIINKIQLGQLNTNENSTPNNMSATTRLPIRSRIFINLVISIFVITSGTATAAEKIYQVAIISHSPPLSYTDARGRLTGFNVEIAHELCAAMKISCALQQMPIERIVDTVAANQADFAVVGFTATPERQLKVLFSKPYFQSITVWLSSRSVKSGNPDAKVAVIKGSAQAQYVESMGWTAVYAVTQKEVPALLLSGKADAAVMTMLNALNLVQDKTLQSLDLQTKFLSTPSLTGPLHMVISPKQPELLERINAAIDQIKRDGRFDRINTQFIPFRLL